MQFRQSLKIVSGGQTGVDRAALDVALELQIPCGGWCPKGRKAEDGEIAARYPLQETPTDEYPERTEWNVRDSDGTLILMWDKPSYGTQLTIELAQGYKKNLLIIDMEEKTDPKKVLDWLKKNKIRILNIAGPRGSFRSNLYEDTRKFLYEVFRNLR